MFILFPPPLQVQPILRRPSGTLEFCRLDAIPTTTISWLLMDSRFMGSFLKRNSGSLITIGYLCMYVMQNEL